MCKITKGKYYKSIVDDIIIKATTSSYGGDSFRAILIEDKDSVFKFNLSINLNEESSGWNPSAFKLLKDYPIAKPKTKAKIKSELFPIY